MTFPTIHLNGTSATDLLEDYTKASVALSRAIAAVEHAGPNARDYHINGPQAFQDSRMQHESRLRRLLDVRGEIEAILENIVDQQEERDARKR